ncbi:MAG: hypothetical protein JW735_10295 [Prolixibacteraceae bacterium]|nr:hypothetical protein [Prolixibacteraceae bacterium]
MTDNFPPLVLECPECGERYLIPNPKNKPSESRTVFSDGFFFDEYQWRVPLIIGCVTCELGFFPENGKLIAAPTIDEYNEKWLDTKKAQPPSAGALALELRVRKNLPYDKEIAIRKELWYAGKHTETGRKMIQNNQRFNQFWLESLNQLEKMLPQTDADILLLKAEINRHLGFYDKTISLLANTKNVIGKEIIARALLENRMPFIL